MFMTWRATQYCLTGRMQPVGHRLGSPDVDSSRNRFLSHEQAPFVTGHSHVGVERTSKPGPILRQDRNVQAV